MLSRREFIGTAAVSVTASGQRNAKPRLRRADSFFGIHLDLHPNPSDTALGRDVTDEMVNRFLDRVKPDYVQYDSKGHVGWLGWPSKVGAPAPGIVRDSLEVWRRATAEHGVALYIHFSGVWDSLAVERHPEWARVRPDGQKEPNQTSLWGPYADQLMIPELKEAAGKYDLDGAWIDGECWATNPDYCEAARRAFQGATGIAELPKKAGDPGWLEFLELNRNQFRKYVLHYVDALHGAYPKFQVASNWLYSTYVPEKPDLPVDFISGDYLGNASISTARLEARYMAQTGKPWDLMAWGFVSGRQNAVGGPIHKSTAQLQQEASVVLAQGGGFQVYYTPTRAGHIADQHIGVMERLGAFCRERQALSHRSETVPQIAVLLSTHDLYTTTGKLFGGWGGWVNPARGLIDALLENHYSVDVLPEWKLDQAGRYPAIAVPDWRDIGTEVREALVEYARNGGKLILAGAATCAVFRDYLNVNFKGAAANASAYIPAEEVFADATGVWQGLEPRGVSRAILNRYPTFDDRRDAECAATVTPLSKGAIAAIYGPVGSAFAMTHTPALRQIVGRVVASVFPNPMVKVDAPPTVEIALRRKSGRVMLHLLNTTAMQVADDYVGVDFIPPVGPVKLDITLPRAPKRVTLEPSGKPVIGRSVDGRWLGTVDRVRLHEIVVFEGENAPAV